MTSASLKSRFASPTFETRKDHRSNLPILPTHILRRILHYRLSLPPLIPERLPAEGEADYDSVDDWDDYAGKIGSLVWSSRLARRKDVQRAACDLMLVCKAFRPMARRHLFAEPYINHNFMEFVKAILEGDKKWSDLNVRSDSTPGRYVTHLDLSQVNLGYEVMTSWEIDLACKRIIPLMPNLIYFKGQARAIMGVDGGDGHGAAAAAAGGKNLQALSTPYSENLISLFKIQNAWPNLKYLHLQPSDDVRNRNIDEEVDDSPLILNQLHSLFLLSQSDALDDWLETTQLPSLRRLHLPAVPDRFHGSTFNAQREQILSLTLLPHHQWLHGDRRVSPLSLSPDQEPLRQYPNLIHLSILASPIRMEYLTSAPTNHPLRRLTLPKWCNTFSRHNYELLFIERLYQTNPLPNLKIIRIDNYRWVSSSLGKTAMQTGESGCMRDWASKFQVKGIQLRDMDDMIAPSCPVSFSGGRARGGSFSLGFGSMSTGGGVVERGTESQRRRSSLDSCDEDGG